VAIVIPQQTRNWKTKLRTIIRESRRLPIIPSILLTVVLIIPSIFAPLVAPHDPLRGALRDRLIPPVWVDEVTINKIVVDKVKPGFFNEQISIRDAQRKLDRDEATYITGSGEPDIGEELEVMTSPGGRSQNLLGTDKLGRDILSRIIYGSRVSVVVAAISISIGAIIGVTLGIAGAYFMGWTDAIIMRLVDISLSIPIILLALVLVATRGPGYDTVILVLAVLMWARFARMVRGEALAIKEMDYVGRAKVAGSSHIRIMRTHIFPNVFNSLVVMCTLWIGFVIILEATLSFLGAGIPRPTAAWGLMIADGRELIVSAWWVAFFPGVAIMLVVLSANLLGDWLRDRLDPKQRQV